MNVRINYVHLCINQKLNKMKKVLLIFTLLGLTTLIVSGQKPQLSFFNEMESKPLGELFKDTTFIPQLQKLHAEIRMGILDTGVERVTVIKQLNQANIPVVSWLLLPKEKGYWFHSKNGPAAIERYHQIRDWAKRNDLKFSGMGLDLELDINDITLAKEHKFKLLIDIIKRLYDKDRVIAGRKIYQGLIDEIRQDGFKVESYFVPFIRYENESFVEFDKTYATHMIFYNSKTYDFFLNCILYHKNHIVCHLIYNILIYIYHTQAFYSFIVL